MTRCQVLVYPDALIFGWMFLFPPEDTSTVFVYPTLQHFLRIVLVLQQSDPKILLKDVGQG